MQTNDEIFKDIEMNIDMGLFCYHNKYTEKSRFYLEAALDKLPPLNRSGDPQRIMKLLTVLENYLRLVYSSELIEASGVKSLPIYEKLLEENDNPLVIEHKEKNEKLDKKIIEIGLPPQTSPYVM